MALYLILQVGASLSRVLPRSWRYRIGVAVGDVVFIVWRTKRRAILANMAVVLGRSPSDPMVRAVGRRSMRNYCKYLIEFLELSASPGSAPDWSMNLQGLEHFEEATSRGKGVIVATAHFGTVEVGARHLLGPRRLHAVYDSFSPPSVDRLVRRTRSEGGVNPIRVSDIREMLRVLRRGEVLALLFDRPMLGGHGVPVRFFGQEAALPGGPAVLALRTGAELMPMYQFREPGDSFRGVILPPVRYRRSGDRSKDVQAIMQALVDTLQAAIEQEPDQWYMFRPMWETRKSVEDTFTRGKTFSSTDVR